MEMVQLDKSLGKEVEFFDPVTRKDLKGILDFDKRFGVFHLRFDELDKYWPIICGKGEAGAYLVVDGKIKSLSELTRDWDHYDILTGFETDGDICTVFESDFDKGDRVIKVKTEK
jgi:hypothetical protein